MTAKALWFFDIMTEPWSLPGLSALSMVRLAVGGTLIMPLASVLADLANPRKDVNLATTKAAVGKLLASENEYTKILVGRLMGTSLADRVKPEGCEDFVLAGLKSKRKELRKGALVWAAKYKTMPEDIHKAVEKARAEEG